MNERPDKVQLIKESQKMLTRINNALSDILNGESEATVCEKYNLDKPLFRRIIFNEKLGFQGQPIKPDEIPKYIWTPEEQLFCDIFHVSPNAQYTIPTDLSETIPIVLKQFSEREQTIIHQYYWEHLSLNDISENLNLTRESVRIIKNRTLYHIHKYHNIILLYGLKSYNKVQKMKGQYQETLRSDYVKNLDEKLKHAIAINDMKAITQIKKECDDFLLKNKYKHLDQIPLDKIGLSVRSYRALTAQGFKSLSDLQNITVEDLEDIKNLGYISIQNIVSVAKTYGIIIKRK